MARGALYWGTQSLDICYRMTLTFWGTQSRASSIDHADRLAQGWKRAPSLFLWQLDLSLTFGLFTLVNSWYWGLAFGYLAHFGYLGLIGDLDLVHAFSRV